MSTRGATKEKKRAKRPRRQQKKKRRSKEKKAEAAHESTEDGGSGFTTMEDYENLRRLNGREKSLLKNFFRSRDIITSMPIEYDIPIVAVHDEEESVTDSALNTTETHFT